MSVNINLKPSTNVSKWESVNSGDFLVLEGTPEHPIPSGLYRVFIIKNVEPPHNKDIFLIPIFEGPFADNMFPYVMSNLPLPTIVHKVNKINIEVEVIQ